MGEPAEGKLDASHVRDVKGELTATWAKEREQKTGAFDLPQAEAFIAPIVEKVAKDHEAKPEPKQADQSPRASRGWEHTGREWEARLSTKHDLAWIINQNRQKIYAEHVHSRKGSAAWITENWGADEWPGLLMAMSEKDRKHWAFMMWVRFLRHHPNQVWKEGWDHVCSKYRGQQRIKKIHEYIEGSLIALKDTWAAKRIGCFVGI